MNIKRHAVIKAFVVFVICARGFAQPTMTVHYIDVGQGDATLVEFPCGAILIDAGAQSNWHASRLISYLHRFFDRRDDLEGTLDSVIVTHQHKDHNRALERVFDEFGVLRYIDNGALRGSGRHVARRVRERIEEGMIDATLIEITDDQITSLGHRHGLTNKDIDPFECDDCDPEIHILSGRLLENPGFTEGDFNDQNNHSLVIRIDFGESSFLFTGDMETNAINTMVDYYSGTDTLDVDVYQAGHHGAKNGTTTELVDAMTPTAAVISCGKERSRGQWTAFVFGHPRIDAIRMMENGVSGTRQPKVVRIATGMRRFQDHEMKTAIYATAWDGHVLMRGFLNKDPKVVDD